eukprot:TRINITY_DN21841_c0_g1_i1.p1 TRINITY_DN21841_c0_g1~~TRINITY_DN21841_c0_g1_i1.p1  ORF type:complete len:547 (+),score=98.79 TRINITY_DN21841_c0_g1_i1:188-1828(+)
MELPVFLIVVIEFCERLCYYTFLGTQKTWLQNQGYGNAQSSSLTSLFGLLSYVSCFFGGWLAETKVGRYRTIAWLVAVYTLGCYLAAVAARAGKESVLLYFVGVFALVALGTGGIKPNVSTFGADQIDPSDPQVARKKELFFSYFYVTINLGSCVAFGFLATAATNGIGSISKQDGFFFAYMVAASAMALALVIFLAGSFCYRKESFETNSNSVIMLWVDCLRSGLHHPLGRVAITGWLSIPVVISMAIVSAFSPSWTTISLTLAVTITCIVCLCAAHRDNAWLGRNEVTQCLDTVPTLLIGNVSFSVLYNSMTTTFFSQACQMDTRLGSGKGALQLNGSVFNLADCLAVIAFTPLISNVCLPGLERYLGRSVTLDMKIYAGLAFAIGAQLVAMSLEYARLGSEVLPIGSSCAPLLPDGSHVHMSSMSAAWMCIPYAMIGIGEVLVNPVLQHFAYESSAPSMRSLMQAFTLFACGGMPGAISTTMNLVLEPYVPNDLNRGNLPAVYFVNVALGLFGGAMYYMVRPGRQHGLSEKTKLMGDAKALYS